MPNLNVKPAKIVNTNNQYAPGVFSLGNKDIIASHQAMVDALMSKGWARTAD